MLRWILRSILVVSAIVACMAPATLAEEASSAPDMDAVMHLMQLSGSANMGDQVIEQLIGSFQQTMPNVPQEFWDAYRAEIDMDELVRLVAPVYAKHFNAADIHALTDFYESPIGRKLVQTQPMIFQESMAIGRSYSESAALQLMEKLRTNGYMDS